MHYQFTDELKTGHASIDGEHKLIISVANEVLKNIHDGMTTDLVVEAIKIFARYVNSHFPNEESLQEKFNYPNYRFHKLWHQSYINDIEITCDRILTEGISPVTIIELKRRIETLIQHIMLEDKKVAKHIQTFGENIK